MSGHELADTIKGNHLYLTASINEPSVTIILRLYSADFHLIFRNGGTTEYCKNYGLGFSKNDFKDQLNTMMLDYDFYLDKSKDYPNNSEKMSQEYLEIINKMVQNKEKNQENQLFKNNNYLSKFLYLKFRKLKNQN